MRLRTIWFFWGIGLIGLIYGGYLLPVKYYGSSNDVVTQMPNNNPSSLTPEPTIFYKDGGPFFSDTLMCPKDISLREGLSWRGITVGKSYLPDLEDVYGVRATRVEPRFSGDFADVYGITLTNTASIERKLAVGVQTCIVNGRIAALAIAIISDSQFSDYIEPWVIQYGPPQIISWSVGIGDSYQYRTLIWPKQGLALYVDRGDLSPKGAWVTTVIFLPPVHDSSDLAKWPYSQLQTTPLISSQGEDPGPLNPFDFAGMLATASAQATQNPTTTVTPTSASTASR